MGSKTPHPQINSKLHPGYWCMGWASFEGGWVVMKKMGKTLVTNPPQPRVSLVPSSQLFNNSLRIATSLSLLFSHHILPKPSVS